MQERKQRYGSWKIENRGRIEESLWEGMTVRVTFYFYFSPASTDPVVTA